MKIIKFYDTSVTKCILFLYALLILSVPSFLSENDKSIIISSVIIAILICIYLDGKETRWKFFYKLSSAYSTSQNFLGFVFMLGYQGFILPKWFRKTFPKSKIHRDWFSGYTGSGILKILERTKVDDIAY
jgi:hypothetical protein